MKANFYFMTCALTLVTVLIMGTPSISYAVEGFAAGDVETITAFNW